jgi:hypothetical protein
LKTCAYCGRENDDAAVHCRECGTGEFESGKSAEPFPKAESPAEARPPLQATPSASIGLFSGFLPRGNSKAVFILVMVCYSWTLSAFVSTLARLAHVTHAPAGYLSFGSPGIRVVALLLVAPLIESIVLIAVIELAKLVRSPTWLQIVISSLIIAASHSTTWRPHGLIVAPSFAIQAAAYCYWSRCSRKSACVVVVCIHALENLMPAIATVASAA